MLRIQTIVTEKHPAYATSTDFCTVFTEDAENLYLLSFLLTADEVKAEVCFVSGFEACAQGNVVFREWARSWARRTIVQNAVRMLMPQPYHGSVMPVPRETTSCKFARTWEANAAIASILGLETFERFVFILSVLCEYSDQDCSILLECPRRNVAEVKVLALQHVAESSEIRQISSLMVAV